MEKLSEIENLKKLEEKLYSSCSEKWNVKNQEYTKEKSDLDQQISAIDDKYALAIKEAQLILSLLGRIFCSLVGWRNHAEGCGKIKVKRAACTRQTTLFF